MKNTGLCLQWDANQGVLLHHSALLVTKLCCWHFRSQHPFRVDRISLLYCILVSEAITTLGLIHCRTCSERRGLWRQLGKSGHILHVVANGGSFGPNLLPWCRGGCRGGGWPHSSSTSPPSVLVSAVEFVSPLSCWAKAKGMGWQGIVRWMRMHFLSYLGAWKHPWTEWCDETQLVSSSPLAGWCQREQGQKCLDGFLFDLWLHNGQPHNLPCHQSD